MCLRLFPMRGLPARAGGHYSFLTRGIPVYEQLFNGVRPYMARRSRMAQTGDTVSI